MIVRNLSSEIPLFSSKNRTCTELGIIVVYDFDMQNLYQHLNSQQPIHPENTPLLGFSMKNNEYQIHCTH